MCAGHVFVVGNAHLDIPAHIVVHRREAVRQVGSRALRRTGQRCVGGAEVEHHLFGMGDVTPVLDDHGARWHVRVRFGHGRLRFARVA